MLRDAVGGGDQAERLTRVVASSNSSDSLTDTRAA
jgi:hypothetical protein